MVAYYQFNESSGNLSINKMANTSHITYNGTSGSNHNPSSVSVFDGISQKINVNSAGVKDFSTTGLSITFANGTYPDGDIWVSKGSINPDTLPDALQDFSSYTIINNYGTNQTFTPLTSISFTDNAAYTITNANDYNLYKRDSNAFGNTWGTILDNADAITGANGATTQISFSDGLYINSFSQFILSNNNNTLSIPDNELINKPSLYPNPLSKNDNLTINVPESWDNSTLIVYNMLGQKVIQASLNIGENLLKLNTNTGIYNVVIFNSKQKLTKKLILNHL